MFLSNEVVSPNVRDGAWEGQLETEGNIRQDAGLPEGDNFWMSLVTCSLLL